MALPSIGGGRQIGDGNENEIVLGTQVAPATATSTATLTTAQLATGYILASPGTSAAAYTLPTGALMDAAFVNMKVNSSFDITVVNVNGSGSGAITMTAGTGWTVNEGGTNSNVLAATTGLTRSYRIRKTAAATYTLLPL
ncbi:MAG TPA: hypothetical protein VIY48_16745 [Candidatus Paceibacterota bacterium]